MSKLRFKTDTQSLTFGHLTVWAMILTPVLMVFSATPSQAGLAAKMSNELASPSRRAPIDARPLKPKLSTLLSPSSPNSVPAVAPASIAKRPAILISGILNELKRGRYFAEAYTALKQEMGFASVQAIYPSSLISVSDNSEILTQSLFREDGAIVIAHSKGGAESLLAVLHHPNLILDGHIDRLVLVQAAIGGSPLANAIVDGAEWDDLLAPNPLAHLLGQWKGLRSLRPQVIQPLFREALSDCAKRLTAKQFQMLSDRIFYVRGSQYFNPALPFSDHNQLAALAVPTGAYLDRFNDRHFANVAEGDNDGFVIERDQKLDGIGVDLGILYADHFDLFEQVATSNASPLVERAFIRAVVREIAVR